MDFITHNFFLIVCITMCKTHTLAGMTVVANGNSCLHAVTMEIC